METISLVREPEARSGLADRSLRQTFVVGLENGLHARPCALLIKTLRKFRSSVDVHAHGAHASGHSMLGLLALAAGRGTALTFTATGDDAAQTLAAVRHLFETGFRDAYRVPGPWARLGQAARLAPIHHL
jgi:phosphotransferase system HPr (HPr) family protein